MLANSIAKLASSIRTAQEELEERLSLLPVEEVAMTAGGIRDGLIRSYAECFKSAGALVEQRPGTEFILFDCKEKLEKMAKDSSSDETVREAYESLVTAEVEWGEFLKRFEASWAAVHPPLFQGSSFSKEGDEVPKDILARQFTEVASKQSLVFSDIISQAPFTLLLFFRVIG